MKYVAFLFLFSLSFLLGGLYFESKNESKELFEKKKTILERAINKIKTTKKLELLQIKLNFSHKTYKISGKNNEKQIIRLIELLNSANIKKQNKKNSTLHIELKVNNEEFNYYLTKSIYANNIVLMNFVNLFVTYANT